MGARVSAYDPVAYEEARAELGDHAFVTASAEECLEDAEVAIISTIDNALSDIPTEHFAGKKVVDPWRFYREQFPDRDDVVYIPMGCDRRNELEPSPRPRLYSGAGVGDTESKAR